MILVGGGGLAGCSHPPQTAEELRTHLPHQYRGTLQLQGEQRAHPIVVEPIDLNVAGPHRLEFNRVRYQLMGGNEIIASGDAPIRGAIATPSLVIVVDEVGDTATAEGGDAIKLGTFQGSLSSDLKKIDATWQTGLGQTVTFHAVAVP